MTVFRSSQYLINLVGKLRKIPKETEWIEFKYNNSNPEEIGKQISALANSAALCGKSNAYLLWGIDDASQDLVGTSFSPKNLKIGNEELENWLLQWVHPKINFQFFEVSIFELPVVILEIPRAFLHPVRFRGE